VQNRAVKRFFLSPTRNPPSRAGINFPVYAAVHTRTFCFPRSQGMCRGSTHQRSRYLPSLHRPYPRTGWRCMIKRPPDFASCGKQTAQQSHCTNSGMGVCTSPWFHPCPGAQPCGKSPLHKRCLDLCAVYDSRDRNFRRTRSWSQLNRARWSPSLIETSAPMRLSPAADSTSIIRTTHESGAPVYGGKNCP